MNQLTGPNTLGGAATVRDINRDRDIHAELGSQRHIIDEIHAIGMTLQARLQPAIKMLPKQENPNKAAPEPIRSQLAQEIFTQNGRLIGILEHLRAIEENVQI